MKRKRCGWCPETSPEYMEYHDTEWGVPVHDDRKLFEMLCLEGMQAGLTWLSILKRRDNYRRLFDNFDYAKVSKYSDTKLEKLLTDPGIIRNRLKVFAIRQNARVFIDIRKEFDSFDGYLWKYVNGKTIKNRFKTLHEVPTESELSQKISKDLKKRGMSFVGPVIIYAYLQAVGVVNDHETGCFRYNP